VRTPAICSPSPSPMTRMDKPIYLFFLGRLPKDIPL
jgi:hypothetical protein